MSEGVERKIPTDEEIDMEVLSDLLDTALSSSNPVVKDQLRKLLVIAALTKSVDPLQRAMGPFRRMESDIRALKREIADLRREIRFDNIDPLEINSRNIPSTATMKAEWVNTISDANWDHSKLDEIMKELKRRTDSK